jgi:hypothetical protein
VFCFKLLIVMCSLYFLSNLARHDHEPEEISLCKAVVGRYSMPGCMEQNVLFYLHMDVTVTWQSPASAMLALIRSHLGGKDEIRTVFKIGYLTSEF